MYDGIILHKIFAGQKISMDLTCKTAMSLITRGLIIGKSK
jgi:hypothetical protein